MDDKKLKDNNLFFFEYLFCELDHIVKELLKHIQIDDLDIKYSALNTIHNILNSFETLHKLYIDDKDKSSIITITRMIVDNCAVVNLIYKKTKSIEEQELRHNLYLLDFLHMRINLLETSISEHQQGSKMYLQFKEVIANNKNSVDIINAHIKASSLFNDICENNIRYANWKYISYSNSKKYSWEKLYELFLPEDAELISKYFSQYVHGLALSNLSNQDVYTDYTIGLSISLMKKTIKLISEDLFKNELEEYSIDFKKTEMYKTSLICQFT